MLQAEAEVDAEPTECPAALDPTYLQLFLLKYICPKPSCQGLLAPVLDQDVFECNVCGNKRTGQEFLAELDNQ